MTVGTVFERSKIPLSKWLAALFLMVASKKGYRPIRSTACLDISYKSTWFMMHRLREAMRAGDLAPIGGAGKIVEIDETFIGKRTASKRSRAGYATRTLFSHSLSAAARARSFHIDEATKENIVPIVNANLDRESHLMTDEARRYETSARSSPRMASWITRARNTATRTTRRREDQHEHG